MVKVESGSLLKRTDKLCGTLTMTGLREVVLAGKVEEFYSPLLGGGRWQIKFISSTDRKVSAVFMEKRIQGEALSSTGARLGDYDIMLTTPYLTESGSRLNLPAKHHKPYYWVTDWCDASQLGSSLSNPSHFGVSRAANPSTPAPDVYTATWSIERKLPLETIPEVMTSEAKIIASLFNDKPTSDVVFVIHNPRKNSGLEERIYAHTKVLSAKCEYFETMFQSDFAEGTSTTSGCDAPDGADLGAQELIYFADSDYEAEEEPAVTPSKDLQSTSNIRTVRITDVSYKTYYAMIYYLYTKSYSFAPLTSSALTTLPSQQNTHIVPANRVVSPWGLANVPVSSAKSMYRLCHRLEISELKTAAFAHIKQSLTPQNITTEISSGFTTRFPEVRQIQKAYMTSHWHEVIKTVAFKDYVGKLFEGEIDGVGDTWLEVLKELSVK